MNNEKEEPSVVVCSQIINEQICAHKLWFIKELRIWICGSCHNVRPIPIDQTFLDMYINEKPFS